MRLKLKPQVTTSLQVWTRGGGRRCLCPGLEGTEVRSKQRPSTGRPPRLRWRPGHVGLTLGPSVYGEHVQPADHELHAAQDGFECSPTQIRKLSSTLQTVCAGLFLAHQLSLLLVYVMCGPRQFFFECGPGKPKHGTPLVSSCPDSCPRVLIPAGWQLR